MPTVIMLVPDEDGVPALQLAEGEVLEYSIGNVEVWRDTVAVEVAIPDPELDPEWTQADKVDGGWVAVAPITDEDGVITGYNVTRRNLTTVEAFRGGFTIVSPTPAYAPNDMLAVVVTASEAMIATLDGRLTALGDLYGIWGEVTADAD